MAGSSLLALIDDITTILDDVATMTKVAATKTSGVLGDDLALNAQQVTGVNADRELPVVWAVAKGSLKNKLILVPSALAISAIVPWAVIPLLMIGGLFLCFEGFEKIAHKFLHSHEEDEAHKQELAEAVVNPNIDLVALEKEKIVGAVRTDFILSAEIIAITLGEVAASPFLTQVIVLSIIGLVMTIGVYGIVAGIVKLDDLGLYLSTKGGASSTIGGLILRGAPFLMKALSIGGTVAMFMVGGGIIAHGTPGAHHLIEHIAHYAASIPVVGHVLESLTGLVMNVLIGLLAGMLTLIVVTIAGRLMPNKNKESKQH